jgi:hypothetical protein
MINFIRNILLIPERIAHMSAQSDALNAKVDALSSSLDSIRADIQTIKDGLPGSGGMTADEVAALDTKLGTVVDKAAALDSENPSA